MKRFALFLLVVCFTFLELPIAIAHAGTDYLLSSAEGYDTVIRAASGSGAWIGGDSTQTVGDINEDGIDDVVVSSYESGYGAYIVFGQEGDLASTIDLETDYNIKLDPAGVPDKQSIQSGDVNGDGMKDLIMGTADGYIYVFFSTFLKTYGDTTGNILDLANGANYNIRYSGVNVVTASNWNSIYTKDVNQDGLGDLLISNSVHSSSAGALYVLFSTMLDDITGTGNNLVLTSSGSYNIRYVGPANSMLTDDGRIAIGDVNGDGFNDILLGSDNTTEGTIWVIFSTLVSGYVDTDHVELSLTSAANFSVSYTGHDNLQKVSFPYASDVNGDGESDLVIGAFSTDFNGSQSGSFYIVLSDKVSADENTSVSLANASAYNLRIDGRYAQDDLGWPFTITFGDFNADASGDMIIIAYISDPNSNTDAGELYYLSSELIATLGSTTGNQWSLANSTSYNLNIENVFANNYLGYVSSYSKSSNSGAFGDVGDDLLFITYELETSLNANQGAAVLMESEIFADYTTTGNVLLLTDPDAYTYRWNGDNNEGKFQDGGVNFGDINGDGLGDVLMFDTKEENYDGAIYIKYGGATIENVPVGLSVVLASDPTVNVSQVRQAGITTVRIMAGSVPVAEVDVDFANPDLDWSLLDAESDEVKSVVAGLADIASAATTHVLFVPKTDNSDSVRICPDAVTLSEVSETCVNGYNLTVNDSNVAIVTIDGQDYWRISNLNNTGGISLASAAPTTATPSPTLAATGQSLYSLGWFIIFMVSCTITLVFLNLRAKTLSSSL